MFPTFYGNIVGAAFLPRAHSVHRKSSTAANMARTNVTFDLGVLVSAVLNACCTRDEFVCICLLFLSLSISFVLLGAAIGAIDVHKVLIPLLLGNREILVKLGTGWEFQHAVGAMFVRATAATTTSVVAWQFHKDFHPSLALLGLETVRVLGFRGRIGGRPRPGSYTDPFGGNPAVVVGRGKNGVVGVLGPVIEHSIGRRGH